MLNNQTIDKLSGMRLSAMAREYRRQLEHTPTNSLSFDERFGMLVDSEWTARKNNQLRRLLKNADLRIRNACLEDLDYSPQHNLDKNMVARLADCAWVKEGRNLIITGATGTGKTYLASAFGNAACRQGFKVKYYRVNRLLTDLSIGHGDGSYNKLMRDLKKTDLIILDDFGMAILDPVSSRDLLEVIEDRFGTKSTIIATQLPVTKWHDLFEDGTIADAILDRVIHNSYRFEPKGDSKRKDNNPDPFLHHESEQQDCI
jgi:DNA replication protein DnaC